MFIQEKTSHIVAVALLLIATQIIVVVDYFDIADRKENFVQNGIACSQEAKLCPDGSYVSRTGPNCEFAKCPDTKSVTRDIISGQQAEELCGPQPPATCEAGKQLGCDLEVERWGCYPMDVNTSTWKTYRNEEYGFEIQYPGKWFFEECATSLVLFSYTEKYFLTCYTELTPIIAIEVADGRADELDYDIKLFSKVSQLEKQTIYVGGENAIKIEGIEGLERGDGYKSIIVLFPHEGDLYRIYYNEITDTNYVFIYNQILSTFKFIK